MDKIDYLDKITQNKLFYGAKKENVMKMLESDGCYIKRYSNIDVVDIQDKLAFVLKGTVSVFSCDDKRNLFLRKVEKDEFFGAAGLFSQKKVMSRCLSKGNSTVLFIEHKAICDIIEKDKKVMYNYFEFLSGRINYLNQKITYLTAGSVERKLALYLNLLGQEDIELKISFSTLSDMLDVGRASLYRTLDKFVLEGIISKNANTITIINKALLLEYLN